MSCPPNSEGKASTPTCPSLLALEKTESKTDSNIVADISISTVANTCSKPADKSFEMLGIVSSISGKRGIVIVGGFGNFTAFFFNDDSDNDGISLELI